MIDIDAAVDALESQVGFHEGANNENPFLEWQTDGVWRNGPYCIAFGMWGIVGHGGYAWPEWCQWGVKGDSYCPYAVTHSKQLGIWIPKGTEEPARGWGVLYSWNRNGVADHYETWEYRNSDGTFITCAGNVSDQVLYKLRDETFVMGYIKYVDGGDPTAPQPTPRPPTAGVGTLAWPTLSTANRGANRAATRMVQNTDSMTIVDGDYWTATRAAVREWQRSHGLEHDGVCGKITGTAIVQVNLNWAGYDCGRVDGDYGEKTTAAVSAFQRDNGVAVDGIWGEESTNRWNELQGIGD